MLNNYQVMYNNYFFSNFQLFWGNLSPDRPEHLREGGAPWWDHAWTWCRDDQRYVFVEYDIVLGLVYISVQDFDIKSH